MTGAVAGSLLAVLLGGVAGGENPSKRSGVVICVVAGGKRLDRLHRLVDIGEDLLWYTLLSLLEKRLLVGHLIASPCDILAVGSLGNGHGGDGPFVAVDQAEEQLLEFGFGVDKVEEVTAAGEVSLRLYKRNNIIVGEGGEGVGI